MSLYLMQKTIGLCEKKMKLLRSQHMTGIERCLIKHERSHQQSGPPWGVECHLLSALPVSVKLGDDLGHVLSGRKQIESHQRE